MYSDRKKHTLLTAAAVVLAALAVLALLIVLFHPVREIRSEGTQAVRDAVLRSARQCYAVEGVYPPSLTYLEENYGLRVNERDYYVVYDAFASNLPPEVRVIHR